MKRHDTILPVGGDPDGDAPVFCLKLRLSFTAHGVSIGGRTSMIRMQGFQTRALGETSSRWV